MYGGIVRESGKEGSRESERDERIGEEEEETKKERKWRSERGFLYSRKRMVRGKIGANRRKKKERFRRSLRFRVIYEKYIRPGETRIGVFAGKKNKGWREVEDARVDRVDFRVA